MKTIKIKKIKMQNYAGTISGEYDFTDDTLICAKSGECKSTLHDVINFVCGFDNMLENSFIPRLFENGKLSEMPIPNLDTIATIELTSDGTLNTITRKSIQKWVTDSDTMEQKYKGNESAYYTINNENHNSETIKREIENIFGVRYEELPIYLDIRYFNSDNMANTRLKKNADTVRREYLLAQCGEIVKEVSANLVEREDFYYIKEMFTRGYTIEQVASLLKNDILAINRDKEQAKIAISSNNSEIARLSTIDYASIEAKIAELENELENLLRKTSDTSNNILVNEKMTELNMLIGKLHSIQASNNKKSQDLYASKLKLNNEINLIALEINNLKNQIEDIDNRLAINISIKDNITAEQLTDDYTCPTCKQMLPNCEIEQLKSTFETNKIKRLADLTAEAEKLAVERVNKQAQRNTLMEQHKTNKTSYDTFKDTSAEVVSTAEIEQEIADKNLEIDKLQKATDNTSTETRIEQIKTEIKSLRIQLEGKAQIAGYKKRNEEIIANNRALADKEMAAKQHQAEVRMFNQERSLLLNHTVNGFFDSKVKFSLYKYQPTSSENEYTECCVASFNGVLYPNLSEGEKIECNYLIQIGLQRLNKKILPIIIDNYSLRYFELTPIQQQRIILANDPMNKATLGFVKFIDNK